MYEAFAGMQNFCKIIDDVVVFDQDEQTHVYQLWQLLCLCAKREFR